MGLFDGTVKSFASDIVTALRARAEVRRKVAEKDAANSTHHRVVAITLDDVAEVIKDVAKL